MKESDAQEFPVVTMKLDDVSGFRISLDRFNFVAEDPLMAGKKALFFLLLEDEMLFHKEKVDRIRRRSKERSVVCYQSKGLIYFVCCSLHCELRKDVQP